MARHRQHSEHHEEHVDESWLIPYADILTLLLALFIVLFASAQVDQKKFEQIAQSLNAAFNGSPSVLEHMKASPDSSPSQPTTPPSTSHAWQQETAQLAQAKKMMDKYIEDNKLSGGLETALLDDGLMIRIKDNTLFSSGSAVLLPQSRVFAAEIAKLLVPLPQRVVVTGHTDNVPISTPEFPTNWDLSAKRALNFMKFILAQDANLKPERFSSTGLGEYHPLVPNTDDVGRARNRRVEVMIQRANKQH